MNREEPINKQIERDSNKKINEIKNKILGIFKTQNYFYWHTLVKLMPDESHDDIVSAMNLIRHMIRQKEDSYEHCWEYSLKPEYKKMLNNNELLGLEP